MEEPARNTGDENPIITMMMRMMEQQNKLMEGIARNSDALRSGESENRHNGNGHNNRAVTLEQFKKLDLPIFRGSTNPMVAEAWIKQMEKIFTALGCGEEQKVVFASFVLQGEADHWWESKARLLRTRLDGRPIT